MQTSIRNFVPLDKLGEGSFASVYKVQRVCDNQIYALKKIRMGHLPPKAKENALNQVRLLASLHSPYITKYYEAFFDQDIECLCIVMELADQGDLRKTINTAKQQKKFVTQLQIWKVLIHLLHGLKMLHDNSILHRDLKCENILVSGGYYKIGDMNVSKINKEGLVCTQTGTPYYASPEVWQDRPYNQKSDMWSFGCIIYEMAALRPPFTGTSMNDLHKNIMRGSFNPIPKIYSNELAQIIHQCLRLNPNERPTVSDLLSNWSVKMYENICIQFKIDSVETNVHMLKTIALPKNIKDLNKCLPKANYQSEYSERKSKVLSGEQHNTEKIKSQRKSVMMPKEIKLIEEAQKHEEKPPIPQSSLSSREVRDNMCCQDNNQEEKTQNNKIVEKEEAKTEVCGEVQKRMEELKLPQRHEQKCLQPTDIHEQINPDSELPKIEASLKKMCSLNEIEDSDQKICISQRKAASAKSIEQMESFNRLIERIKSSAKTATNKIQKIQRKKSRRMLIDVNSNKLPENKQRSKSRSIRRTERSTSKESIQQIIKPHQKIDQGRHQRRQKADTENRLFSKYMLNAPIASKYTKVLEEAKGYLRRSSSRKNKIF